MIEGTEFNEASYKKLVSGKPKPFGDKGAKIININHADTRRAFRISTPEMMTWGISAFTDDKGDTKYSITLAFPSEDKKTADSNLFLENMKSFQKKLYDDIWNNAKDWLGKVPKGGPDALEDLVTPMLKYPKVKDSNELDYSRAPGLTVKLSQNQTKDEWTFDIFSLDNGLKLMSKNTKYPDTSNIEKLLSKFTNLVCIIEFGGLWVVGGKIHPTWKLVSAYVREGNQDTTDYSIDITKFGSRMLGSSTTAKANSAYVDDDDDDVAESVTIIEEPEPVSTPVQQEEPEEKEEPEPEPEPVVPAAPVKKVSRVVKKKA